MKLTGRIDAVNRDYFSNKVYINLEINEARQFMDGCDELKDCILDIELKKYRKKRSLDANAYFHLLVGKLADKLLVSKPYCKNFLMGRYGQREFIDGKPVILSILSDIDLMEREDIHTMPIGYGHIEDKDFTHWAVIRGTHTYNTKEMSILISGTVDECKAQGIETLTPDKLKRMIYQWQPKASL